MKYLISSFLALVFIQTGHCVRPVVITSSTWKVNTSGTSMFFTFPSGVPRNGSLLVIGNVQFAASPQVTVSDDQPGQNTYTDQGFQTIASNAEKIVFAPNIRSTSTMTLRFTSIPGSAGPSAFISEVLNADRSSPLDASGGIIGTATAGGVAVSSPIANIKADGICYSNIATGSGANPAIVNTASNWTIDGSAKELNGSVFEVGGMGYQVTSTVTTRTLAWAINNSVIYATTLSCFKAERQRINHGPLY